MHEKRKEKTLPNHQLSHFTMEGHISLLESWGSSSVGKQVIYKFIIASPVKRPSSLIGSFTTSRLWVAGCRAIAWNWMRRKRSSSGWVRLIVWQNVFSIRSSTAVTLSKHRKLFVISMLILIMPSVSLKTLPGWRGRVSSILASSGRSVGHPRTLWWSRCSWHTSTTVIDISMECRSVSSARYLASYWLRHGWSCCFVAQCGRPDMYRTALAWHSIDSNV